ncbi:MAG: dipeptidase [Gemmatimonadota bacterium]
MSRLRRRVLLTLPVLLAACAGEGAEDAAPESAADLEARARSIHERVMTLDTHVDINPANFTPEQSYATRLETQVNLPKMEEGGLDAVFLIVYVGQDDDLTATGFAAAHAAALEKFEAIHRLTEELAPDRIGLARTSEEAREIHASGRKVAFIGVENGYPLGTDLANVQKFAELGARYLSLAHNGHSQLSDSNTGERDGVWMHDGLSDLGREVVAELNRQGIMIDISHPSKTSMMQTIELSRAPIMASHSAVRALCDHSRNLDDEQLLALKENGGVVQVVAFNSYVKCQQDSPERQAALAALREEFGAGGGRGGAAGMTDAQRAEFRARMDEIDQQFPPPPRATVAEFVDHIDYAVDLIGIDHVGISSDFDGGGGVDGWMDASETFNVTLELVRRGYTEEQIEQLWSGNLLRVLDDVQRVAQEMRGAVSD